MTKKGITKVISKETKKKQDNPPKKKFEKELSKIFSLIKILIIRKYNFFLFL